MSGVAVLDFLFQMQEFPDRPDKYRAEGASITGGGNAANAAVAIARLEGSPHLSSRLGDDEIADLILSGLKKEDVNCDLARQYKDKRSSFSSIYIDATGERQIMNFRDNSLTMDADWLAQRLNGNFAAALADSRWPDGARVAMQYAKDNHIPGILDAEAPVMEAEDALYLASHVAFSAQGVREFSDCHDLEQAAKHATDKVPGRVIVTDGSNGVLVWNEGRPAWHPAFNITPVDTLAAGDVWHGAFALALGESQSEVEAIRFASAAAALKCLKSGGRNGAPSRSEVTQFLAEH